MEVQTFEELLESYEAALKASGSGLSARLGNVQRATVITRRHEVLGLGHIDDAVISEYILEISHKLNDGAIGTDHAYSMQRETERFARFVKTGEVKLLNPQLGARVALLPEFQKVVDDFLESKTAHIGNRGNAISPNTRNDMRWVAHKYFEWLTAQGFTSLHGLGAEQIQKFMLN